MKAPTNALVVDMHLLTRILLVFLTNKFISEIGVRTERTHQIWHADITQFVTGDNIRHYIYLVIDNFSRKIIAWEIADAVKAVIRKATIEDALEK